MPKEEPEMEENGATGKRISVTVNDEEISVRSSATWGDAVTAWRSWAGAALGRGEAYIRDAVGAPVDAGGRVVPGATIHFVRCGVE